MQEPQLTNLLATAVVPFSLPLGLVKAICFVESSFNEYALRYEPGYKWLVGSEEKLTATERMGQMCSWGLMQLMGGVAREYGYTGDFPRLCVPEVNLNFGMMHVQKFYRKYQNWPDTIASYNAGRPVRIGAVYANQQYVDKVMTAWQWYEPDGRHAEGV